MDRQNDEVDDGSSKKKKNESKTSSTQEEGSCSSCPPLSPVAVPKKGEVKEEEKPSFSSSCNTKTTVSGDSNVGEKKKAVNREEEEKPPPVGEADETCGTSTTTTLQLTTITTRRKDDDSGKIQNKVEMSTPASSTKNTTTAMSGQNITTTRSQDDNNTTTSISVSSTTYDTTSSSKTTVNNGGSDSCCKEKVLDGSVKDNNVNKSGISSSVQPNQKQQVKGKDISCDDGEIENKNLVVGSNSGEKSSVVVSTPTTISNINNFNTDVKMTSIVDGDVGKGGGGENKDDSQQQQQHGPVVVPVQDIQVSCNVSEEKHPSSSSDCCTVNEEMQNQPEKPSSIIVANKDAEGRRKEDTQPPGGEKTTCPEQPPKRLGSSDYIHLSKDEGNVICSNNNGDNQQVKVTGDDGSLNQVASQKNTESSPIKPAASVSTSAAVNPLNPVHKTDFPNQKNEDVKTLPNEPSGNIGNTAPESTLQQTSAPPPTESKLDKFSSDSTDIMKPSTNSSLESAGNKLSSVNTGSQQTNTSIVISSSPLKQPLEKADDESSRVTAVSTAPTQTVQSSTDDSSKRFPSRDLAGASQTVEHSSNNKSSSKQCVQGQDDITDCSMLSKGSAELTNLSSARPEVPKKSEQDAAVRTATLSLGDTVRDTDELSSKRSESDSQDVTPSDSLSIPSDRDLECVDIADNDTGAASLKVTKDGASSSSSSSVLSIYHLKWIHFKSKKVPVITQNENGPCPLLAIMNVLLLQGRVNLESGLELITSEQLMDHLDECILENVPKTASEDVQLNYQQNMQDGMAVIHKLQTGLDVNVRFTGVQDFEYTTECIIFDLLGISLYHGWLVDPQSHDVVSAIGMCSYNQLVEKIIVQKTSEDLKLFTEATIAENFLEKTASQLTYHGLCELSTTVKEGELCVFFRNNHFSTLYRHKNELFLLVTDQGFLNECNVVWETLSSVEGDCYFVDAEFNTYTKPDPVSGNSVVTPPVVPIGSDQQIDQDYLVALSLDREQQLQREVWASHAGGSAGVGGGGLGAGAAVPDPLKGPHVQLTDLELAKKLQDEENQRAGAAAATAAAPSRRNPRAADPCTSSGTRRTRDREKDKDSCLIL